MYVFLNKVRNRFIITTIIIIFGVAVILSKNDINVLRGDSLGAVKSISFLLAVMAALSIALFNNYVAGLRDRYLEQVRFVRTRLEEIYDKLSDSSDKKLSKLNDDFISPLVGLSSRQWLAFDPANDIRSTSKTLLESIHEENPSFLPRHLLRIEDEINELGRLYIRRVVVKVYLDLLKMMYLLIAFGMFTIAIVHIMPNTYSFNVFSILLSFVVVFWSISGTLMVSGFLYNNGKEEGGELYDDDFD